MDLNQLFHDLDKPRTHKEMEEYFHDIKSTTNRSDKLTKLARLKKGRYKEFLEEFYPLYCFSKSKYCTNASRMKIVVGNQGYDAVIIIEDGSEEKYEITGYQDGKWDSINAKSLNESGIGVVNITCVKSLEEKGNDYFLKTMVNVENKAKKDYSDTNIIFVVNTHSYFEVFDNDSNTFINRLRNEIGRLGIRANKIYLLRLGNQGLEEIDKNIFIIK